MSMVPFHVTRSYCAFVSMPPRHLSTTTTSIGRTAKSQVTLGGDFYSPEPGGSGSISVLVCHDLKRIRWCLFELAAWIPSFSNPVNCWSPPHSIRSHTYVACPSGSASRREIPVENTCGIAQCLHKQWAKIGRWLSPRSGIISSFLLDRVGRLFSLSTPWLGRTMSPGKNAFKWLLWPGSVDCLCSSAPTASALSLTSEPTDGTRRCDLRQTYELNDPLFAAHRAAPELSFVSFTCQKPSLRILNTWSGTGAGPLCILLESDEPVSPGANKRFDV